MKLLLSTYLIAAGLLAVGLLHTFSLLGHALLMEVAR